ncbi:MAG TPA: hypothetical protein PKJ32_11205 [Piscinibacter sp.]|nr:hypothetical protein [Piscinibacter sp.]
MRDFVRSSGPVRPRLQGGVDDWAGEDNFADASLTLRFPDQLSRQTIGEGELASTLGHVFRRFYSSGVVCRYEVGFRVRRSSATPLAAADTAKLLAATTTVSMRVPRTAQEMPLLKAGPTLAKRYLEASTNRQMPGDPQPWWVVQGEPALLVEYADGDAVSLLPHARVVPSARVGAEILHHTWLEIAGKRLSTWTLRNDHPATDRNQLRKLRIHLLRLHTERECLRLVLEAAMQQRLATTVPQADELQAYLNAALPVVTRPLSHGVEQSQLLEIARAAWSAALPGQSTSFAALGQQVADKVARYVRRSEAVAPVITHVFGDQMNTHIQMGNVTVAGDFNLVTAQNIQNSFNKAAGSDVPVPLKDALKELTTKVAELAKQLPPEKAEQVSKDLAALTTEAVSKEPRKAWYELSASGLLEAAKAVASMTTPIATAVKAVISLLA